MNKKVEFKNKYGLKLKGVVIGPETSKTVVVFLHGFPGTMNGTARRICNELTKHGILCLRFNFSGTPPSQGKFEDKLMSKEVSDVKYAVDFLKKNYPDKKIVLMGHSTGAIDGALYAHKDKRLAKVILSGVVGNLKEAVRFDFTDEQVRDFWKKGYITYKIKGDWVNNKKLKKAFYDEFFKLDVLSSIHKLRKPLLIIHGSKDIIPATIHPPQLYKAARKPKKLIIIKGADHGFTAKKYLRQYIKEVLKFID